LACGPLTASLCILKAISIAARRTLCNLRQIFVSPRSRTLHRALCQRRQEAINRTMSSLTSPDNCSAIQLFSWR
jgi:hypothetical protein